MNPAMQITRLSFSTGKRIVLAAPEQIIRFEASSNYTYVYFTDRPPLLIAKVLRRYDEILRPYGFIRTHRSHLVNKQHIVQLDQSWILHMKDASCAGISRSKRKDVKKEMSEKMYTR